MQLKTALVITADAGAAAMISALLQSEGYTAQVVAAPAAVAALQDLRPAILLYEAPLPETLAGELERLSGAGSFIPLIVFPALSRLDFAGAAPTDQQLLNFIRAGLRNAAANAAQIDAEVARRSAARVSELSAAHEALLQANAELARFAYLAAHDLQEPARTTRSYTQLLQRKYGEQLDERAGRYIGFIVDAADRMQRLIDDLLVYSRLNARKERFAALDTSTALRAALARLRVEIDRSGATINHAALPTVWGDGEMISNLLERLIDNAIKFHSAEAPQITVAAALDGAYWRFTVRDNGIGIAPEYFERVFMPLQRLNSRAEYAGSGIGLAICKKIVEQHGGRIWLASQPDAGATFYFTLPAPSNGEIGRDAATQQHSAD